MKNGNNLGIGSAMLMTRIIDIEKARGTRVPKFQALKSPSVGLSQHRTLYFIFSGFTRHWIRMTGPGPEAA